MRTTNPGRRIAKGTIPGRPRGERYTTKRELLPALMEECRRRFTESTGIAWDADVEEFIDRTVRQVPKEEPLEDQDRRLLSGLSRALKAAVNGTRGRRGDFPDWVRAKISPALDDSRLRIWSLRKRPGSMLTEYVFALDKLNFMDLGEDREAKDGEFACLMILKGMPLPWQPPRPISVPELISLVTKTVKKARAEYGWPPFVREMRRQRDERERADTTGELRRMREGTIRTAYPPNGPPIRLPRL